MYSSINICFSVHEVLATDCVFCHASFHNSAV